RRVPRGGPGPPGPAGGASPPAPDGGAGQPGGPGAPDGPDAADRPDAANEPAAAEPQARPGILACIVNFSGRPHLRYEVGLPRPGRWREVINTDAFAYGGSGGR